MILGVGLATFGAGFIQGPPHLTWGIAEFITVFCALLFALHILFTQHITTRRDPVACQQHHSYRNNMFGINCILLGDGTNQEQWNLIFSEGVIIPVLLLGIGVIFLFTIFEHVSTIPSSNTSCDNICLNLYGRQYMVYNSIWLIGVYGF